MNNNFLIILNILFFVGLGWTEDIIAGTEDDFYIMADINCENSPPNELMPTGAVAICSIFSPCFYDVFENNIPASRQ